MDICETRQYSPHSIHETVLSTQRYVVLTFQNTTARSSTHGIFVFFCRKRQRIRSKTNLAYHFDFSQEWPLSRRWHRILAIYIVAQRSIHICPLSLFIRCMHILHTLCMRVYVGVDVDVSVTVVNIVFHCIFLIVISFVEKFKLKHCLLACALFNSKNAARNTGVILNL